MINVSLSKMQKFREAEDPFVHHKSSQENVRKQTTKMKKHQYCNRPPPTQDTHTFVIRASQKIEEKDLLHIEQKTHVGKKFRPRVLHQCAWIASRYRRRSKTRIEKSVCEVNAAESIWSRFEVESWDSSAADQRQNKMTSLFSPWFCCPTSRILQHAWVFPVDRSTNEPFQSI